MNSRFLLVLAGMLVFSYESQAQKYITGLGVRIEKYRLGLTLQQRVLPKSTIEFLGMAGTREVGGTALFEQHFPIVTSGLNYYIGGGAHVGHLKENGTFYGVDGVLGLEAKLLFTRLLFSADLKPAIHINHEDYFGLQGGFSVRYILIKEKKKKLHLFGNKDKNDAGGIFGNRKKEEEKRKFNLFNREPEPEQKKFRLFPEKESPEKEDVKEKKKFKLFE